MSNSNDKQTQTPARLASRLLAISYDALIVFFISLVVIIVIQLIISSGGSEIPPDHISNELLKAFWVIPGLLYFGYFWTKSGQTPCMKVWKIKVVNQQGGTISWPQAIIRFFGALFGLGLLWTLFNKERNGIQDLVSKTSLVNAE